MTREEAIKILSSYKNSFFGDALHGVVISVSEIIDLLSAQTDNDWIPVTRKAIYLDDAIDAIYKCTDYYIGNLSTMIDKADAYKALDALPPAQPEPCGDMISREYLKEHIEACWINGRPRHAPELNELLSWIDDVPSAQPEIIHCRECKHWIPGYITDQDDFIPPKCGKYQQMVGHSASDYCSLAERREE